MSATMSPATSAKKTMLSAVTPSNRPTIGNYLGAIRNWVDLQAQYDCVFFATDLHALTAKQDPVALKAQTLEALALYVAAGIDPEAATLFVQSHVPEHTELTWILICHASMGELSRMTQYKDKSAKAGTHIGAGLFTYPVLMAADILLYQTHVVPVGEDQKQHVELTRDLAIRMNHLYPGSTANADSNALFVVPEVVIPATGARIMSLQNPAQKMSKSDPDPHATVYLMDSDDVILKKLKRAVTDSGTEITHDESKPGVRNLIEIQLGLTGESAAAVVARYQGKMYGHLKVETADMLIAKLGPVRDRAQALLSDRTELDRILARGAERARARAQKTLRRVYDRLGFVPGGGVA